MSEDCVCQIVEIAVLEWGTLEPGKLANLLIIDGRPDRTVGDTRKIEAVMQAGKIIDRASFRFAEKKDAGFRPITPAAWLN
jgi:hypothetical protein